MTVQKATRQLAQRRAPVLALVDEMRKEKQSNNWPSYAERGKESLVFHTETVLRTSLCGLAVDRGERMCLRDSEMAPSPLQQ